MRAEHQDGYQAVAMSHGSGLNGSQSFILEIQSHLGHGINLLRTEIVGRDRERSRKGIGKVLRESVMNDQLQVVSSLFCHKNRAAVNSIQFK